MTEMLTVVDIHQNKIGVKTRDAVHRDGDWHETFQCWFIERAKSSYYIYLQLRSASKNDFPLMYDITAAGHLLVGETVEDGVREIKEELGVEITIDQLLFLQAIPNSINLPNFIDNEISLVYLYEVKTPLAFSFIDEEVEAIVRMQFSDFEKLVNGEVNDALCEKYEDGKFIRDYQTISMAQFVPHEVNYFTQVVNKIKEYVNNKDRYV